MIEGFDMKKEIDIDFCINYQKLTEEECKKSFYWLSLEAENIISNLGIFPERENDESYINERENISNKYKKEINAFKETFNSQLQEYAEKFGYEVDLQGPAHENLIDYWTKEKSINLSLIREKYIDEIKDIAAKAKEKIK